MDPKKVIASFFILAILAVAVGVGIYWYNEQQGPDGHFNYSGERVETYESKEGLTINPTSEDKIFFKTDITLKNDRFDNGIDTEQLVWKLTVDGTTVNQFDLVIKNKDFKEVVVQKGETVKYTVIFEIPKNTLAQKTELGYLYTSLRENPHITYDSNLSLPDSTQMVACAAVLECTRY